MKRHKALSKFSSDHHSGLNMAKTLKSGANTSDAQLEYLKNKLVHFFKTDLENHFDEEEKYLAPLLKDNPMIIRMCDDHQKMKSLFNSVLDVNGTELKEYLISFGEILDSHIRFEERELFPMIEKTLSEEQLAEIGRLIQKQKI